MGFSTACFAKSDVQALDGIAAVVNDSIITQSELDSALALAHKQLAATHNPAADKINLKQEVLKQLIDKHLQLQLAKAAGIKVTSEQVKQAIENIAKQNNLTADELYEKLSLEGMTKEGYQQEIHDEMVVSQLQQQQVGSRISVSPKEIDEMIHSKDWQAFSNKQYHLEDIIVPLPESPSTQDIQSARLEGKEVLAAFEKGINAEDIISAENANNHNLQGGDVGWVRIGQVPPVLADKISHLKANQSLGPLQTPTGFHVIHLVETRLDKDQVVTADARKQVEQLIFQRKMNENLQTWLAKMRSEAYIDKTA